MENEQINSVDYADTADFNNVTMSLNDLAADPFLEYQKEEIERVIKHIGEM